MEELLEKLRNKPVPKSFEQIPLFFKKNTTDLGDTTEDNAGRKPAMVLDERQVYETLNRRDIIQQVLYRRNAPSVLPFEPIRINKDNQEKNDVEEEDVEEENENEPFQKPTRKNILLNEEKNEKTQGFKYVETGEDNNDEDTELVEIQTRIHRGKPQKNIAEPKQEILEELQDRIPSQEPIKIRLSKYYLNNRKIVVEKLAKFFEPRRAEYIEASTEVSCEKQQQADKLELLTHQKIVRDYLNLMTPYRGLLLYFGLGSGKSCSSIAIAEGMKSAKEVVLLTPASLRSNFFTELKKCGDPLIKVNQYWEFINTEGQPDLANTLSAVLSLDQQWIHKNKGAWLMDIHQKANFAELSQKQQIQIQEQLDEMIAAKYISINYNANNIRKKIEPLTLGGTVNPFDNKVIIIDEAHNFVSKIVHKLNYNSKTKRLPKITTENVAYQLYTYLMSAIDARVVLLTGTPVINSPNEIAVLFNILRGYIQQWEIPISPQGQQIVSKTDVANLLAKTDETNVFDYLDVRANNTVVITRNPFGFVNVSSTATEEEKNLKNREKIEKERVYSVKPKTIKAKVIKNKTETASTKKTRKNKKNTVEINTNDEENKNNEKREDTDDVVKDYYYEDAHSGGGVKNYVNKGVELNDAGNIDDQEFIKRVLQTFSKAGWRPSPLRDVKKTLFTALPDNSEEFNNKFVDLEKLEIKNKTIFQKRILGLTSYYRSEQENLLPRLIRSPQGGDYFVVRVPMSDHQFGIYAEIRKEEAKQEKARRGLSGNDLFSSTYRIYSRAACNFVFPDGMVRPRPKKGLKNAIGGGHVEYGSFVGGEDENDFVGGEGEDEEDNEDQEQEINEEEKEEELIEPIQPEPTTLKNTKKTKTPVVKPPKVPKTSSKRNPVVLEDEEEAEKEIDELDDIEYAQKIAEVLETLKNRKTEQLTQSGLKTNSPKFLEILRNIKNPDNLGKHLIYSQFRHLEGIAILKMVLETNGFAQFRIFKKTTGETGNVEWGIVPFAPEDEKKPKFILYTGTETTEEKETLLHIYNGNWNLLPKSLADTLSQFPDGNNNIYGKVIQVMMITQSGAEGINLKNTRFVHIVEPYWNMVRCSQVVGRARRICSHTDLPKELQTVQVFLYMSVFSEEQKRRNRSGQGNKELELRDVSKREKDSHGFLSFTTDQTLFENAQMKDEINQKFLQAVKETSIDCSVYNEEDASQCFTFKNPNTEQIAFHPDIQQDENEIAEVVKVLKKMVRFQNKYAIEPDYKEHDENTLYDLDSYKKGKLEPVGIVRKIENEQYEIVLN